MDTTIDPYRDVAMHVAAPKQLESVVREQLQNPSLLAEQRRRTTAELIGVTGGCVSLRVADYLERFH